MSGGSYSYASDKVDEFIRKLEENGLTPLRTAFRDLLVDVGRAMHDIEWVDSRDSSEGSEIAAIAKALGAGRLPTVRYACKGCGTPAPSQEAGRWSEYCPMCVAKVALWSEAPVSAPKPQAPVKKCAKKRG